MAASSSPSKPTDTELDSEPSTQISTERQQELETYLKNSISNAEARPSQGWLQERQAASASHQQ
jgi:predicted 3-demethylubiquinone-9 3-methyltransferase (glyoxalase superfamily)